MTAGALTDRRAAVLPVVAAMGGVIAPALIYVALNRGTPAAHGWSIPTATDVAFTLGILAVLGEKDPARVARLRGGARRRRRRALGADPRDLLPASRSR